MRMSVYKSGCSVSLCCVC